MVSCFFASRSCFKHKYIYIYVVHTWTQIYTHIHVSVRVRLCLCVCVACVCVLCVYVSVCVCVCCGSIGTDVQIVRYTWRRGRKTKPNHPVADSLQRVSPDNWSLTASTGKVNDWGNRDNVVLNLFSNIKCLNLLCTCGKRN